jgi:DNA modification methylase
MDGHLKINEKKLNNCDDEIYDLETEKEQIIKKLNVIIEESVNIDLSNEHKKKELNSIKKKYERQKNIEKNKEKDENELINILNKIENMKKIIEKNNNKINMINYDNDEMENDIYIMQAENDKLIDKYKQAQKEINTLNKYGVGVLNVKSEGFFQTNIYDNIERDKNSDFNNHITVKPLDLIEKLVVLTTPVNSENIVIDPFMGSGTTAVACKKHNIKFTININSYYKFTFASP